MTRGIELQWDSASGCVQIRLPSGTRLNISREAPSFLWNFLDALHQVHEKDPKYLTTAMSEKTFRHIFNRWKTNGNKAMEEALAQMEEKKRDRLTPGQIQALQDKYFAEGHVVIRPLQKPPKDLKLSDLISDDQPLNLDGLT